MSNVDMIFIVRYEQRNPYGVTESHVWCKRVSTGREGIELRDRIVSDGNRADDRIVVTQCKCVPLVSANKAAT